MDESEYKYEELVLSHSQPPFKHTRMMWEERMRRDRKDRGSCSFHNPLTFKVYLGLPLKTLLPATSVFLWNESSEQPERHRKVLEFKLSQYKSEYKRVFLFSTFIKHESMGRGLGSSPCRVMVWCSELVGYGVSH